MSQEWSGTMTKPELIEQIVRAAKFFRLGEKAMAMISLQACQAGQFPLELTNALTDSLTQSDCLRSADILEYKILPLALELQPSETNGLTEVTIP